MTEIGSSGSGETEAQAGDPVPGQGQAEPGSLNLTANVADERMFSWQSQAAQYPPTGPPGFSYVRGQVTDELFVDCLLYRDETGGLVGILNRYPTDFPPLEREGDQNIWVHPDRRRQGIGSALITEAFFRWGPSPNADDLKLTESGVQLLQGMEEKRREASSDACSRLRPTLFTISG
jgi:GNAT superfamily N-acetyltransferase